MEAIKKLKNKKFTIHNTFRCDHETQDMLETMTKYLYIKKSALIRECIQDYYSNLFTFKP